MNKVVLAFAAIAAFAISAQAEFTPGWTATAMNASGTTIRPEGELVYAYCRGDNNTTNTVNGVKFLAFDRSGMKGDIDVKFSVIPNVLWYEAHNWGDEGVKSADYGKMLSNGWWQNEGGTNYVYTLTGLEEGERYMVQLVFHRNDYSGFSVKTYAPNGVFVKPRGTDWTYGGTLVGVFDATNTVYEFALDVNTTPGYLNAIQVRKITGCEPIADDTWFLGNIGGSAYDGEWNVPESGVTLDETKYVLEEPADPLEFSATERRQVSAVQQITFETSAKFAGSYDELPAIPADAKAGVVVANNNFYVLAKDTTTNAWVDTGISAESVLDSAVEVSVNITNGTDGVHALYTFGNSTPIDKVVVASGTWGDVAYKGSGEVARLAGVFTDFPWEMPNGYSVLVDPEWAASNHITVADFASANKLGNGFSASESYVLGLNTNEVLKIVWDREEYGTGSEAATYFRVKPDHESKEYSLINWCVYTNGVCETSGVDFQTAPARVFERSAFRTGGEELLIKLVPMVSGQESNPGESKTLAVRCSPLLLNESIHYMAIPYECDIETFLANFWDESHATADRFDVYDATANAWDTWQWTGGVDGKWEFVPTAEHDDPYNTVLRPGQAIKITLNKSSLDQCYSKIFYIVGVPGDTNQTSVVQGKFNLVGSPNGADFALSKLADGSKIKIVDVVSTNKLSVYALPNATYRQTPDKTKWLYISGNTGAASEATEISGGKAFFLLPKADVINW